LTGQAKVAPVDFSRVWKKSYYSLTNGGSFELISHWIPQFIWLGLMLEQGELLENYRSESSAIT
jgi:hypothetical protein